MKEEQAPKTKIHIQSIDLGPHRSPVIVLPKNADKEYSAWVWVIATIIIGISVASFFYNGIERLISFAKNPNTFVWIQGENISENNSLSNSSDIFPKNMGSDDADFLLDATSTKPVAGQYYFWSENYKIPRTSALSFLVADIDTGEIIIEKNPDMVLPIASISKIIASLVSKDVLDQHEPIVVSRSSIATYGTMGGLVAGEKILVTDLEYPLLMESSNDAAEVLADAYGRDNFVGKMNEKVKELGMPKTSFGDPSGLSAKNVSTASDLFTLAKYITKDRPEIWDVTRVRGYSILGHSWVNNNTLSRKTSFIGGKNGYTEEANRTTLSVFYLPIEKKYKRRIAVVVLKSADRNADVDMLIRFLDNNVGFMPASAVASE